MRSRTTKSRGSMPSSGEATATSDTTETSDEGDHAKGQNKRAVLPQRPFVLDDNVDWNRDDVTETKPARWFAKQFVNPIVEAEFVRFSFQKRRFLCLVGVSMIAVIGASVYQAKLQDHWTCVAFLIIVLLSLFAVVTNWFYCCQPIPRGLGETKAREVEMRIVRLHELLNAVLFSTGILVALPALPNQSWCYDKMIKRGWTHEAAHVKCVERLYPYTCSYMFAGSFVLQMRPFLSAPILVCLSLSMMAGRLFDDTDTTANFLAKSLFGWLGTLFGILTCLWHDDFKRRNFAEYVTVVRNRNTANKYRQLINTTLEHLLPESTLEKLTNNIPVLHHSVCATVSVCEVHDVLRWMTKTLPETAIKSIDMLVSSYDQAAKHCDVDKIKTVGDAYFCAANLRSRCDHHAFKVAKMALLMRNIARKLEPYLHAPIAVRIGIHTGRTIGGIIGTCSLGYEIYGETCRVASHVARMCAPNAILVTDRTLAHIGAGYFVTHKLEECVTMCDLENDLQSSFAYHASTGSGSGDAAPADASANANGSSSSSSSNNKGETFAIFSVISKDVGSAGAGSAALRRSSSLPANPLADSEDTVSQELVDNRQVVSQVAGVDAAGESLSASLSVVQRTRYQYLLRKVEQADKGGGASASRGTNAKGSGNGDSCWFDKHRSKACEAYTPRDDDEDDEGLRTVAGNRLLRGCGGSATGDNRPHLLFGKYYAEAIERSLEQRYLGSRFDMQFCNEECEAKFLKVFSTQALRDTHLAYALFPCFVAFVMLILVAQLGFSELKSLLCFTLCTVLFCSDVLLPAKWNAMAPLDYRVRQCICSALFYLGAYLSAPCLATGDFTYMMVSNSCALAGGSSHVPIWRHTFLYWVLVEVPMYVAFGSKWFTQVDVVRHVITLCYHGFVLAVGLYSREKDGRRLFRMQTMNRAQLQAVKEESSLHRSILSMLVPDHMVDIASSGTRAIHHINDLCIADIRMNNFLAKLHELMESSSATLEALEDLFFTIEGIFHQFESQHVRKVRSVGDTFLIAGPINLHQEQKEADVNAAAVAIVDMLSCLHDALKPKGITFCAVAACGGASDCVIGAHQPSYELFGPAVAQVRGLNDAAVPGTMAIAENFKRVLDRTVQLPRHEGDFVLSNKSSWVAKGVGVVPVFFLRKSSSSTSSSQQQQQQATSSWRR